ncbi:hypothetical protein Cni_G11017 [Canna indica]|uniref:Glycine-rich protein n=1 Tax=Canna indica TaxID=4628 RepID=A0AAQ3K5A2_9LILI|nr:hypothetical protein Cni_G11017 [Canna indica]
MLSIRAGRTLVLLLLFSSIVLQLQFASAGGNYANESVMEGEEKGERGVVFARKLKRGGGRSRIIGGGRPLTRGVGGGGIQHGRTRSAAFTGYNRHFGITFVATAIASII